jgi:hypothetical protein
MLWVVVVPLVFLAMYFYIVLPETSFGVYYAASLGITWWLSGLAYLVAAVMPVRSTWVTGKGCHEVLFMLTLLAHMCPVL